ncbi:MAG TPA: hypothetical protein VJZ76_17985 [Thermoanaerobaculia bacterium]|nr:hypothetical protein [Thermoanaerobaculia bacterium]
MSLGATASQVQLPESLLELPRLEKVDVRWVEISSRVLDQLEARGCLVYR